MRFTFTFNGISNTEMGVIVSKRPPLKTPQQRMHFYNVGGTYGSTSKFQGYEPLQNQMEIIVETVDYLDDVKEWLTGNGAFTRSDRPNMFQEVWFIDTMEFEKIPSENIYIGTIKWTSYYPIWALEEEEISLISISHNTSWNHAYKVINKGTAPSQPVININNAQSGDIKIGDTTLTLLENASQYVVNTLTGEIYQDGVRRDKNIKIKGIVELVPGETLIYSDNDLSELRIVNPSRYL